MAKLVSKRYALALFETGLELDKVDQFKEEINAVSNVLIEENDFKKVLNHPKVSKDEKKEILNHVFGGKVSEEILNFLYVIVDKRREMYIEEISEYFDFLYNEEKNIALATVVTAIPMDESTQNRLKEKLSKELNKNVVLKNLVDESIIGGAILKIDNKIIDGTVKGQLESIEKNLKGMRV